ncbi:MAG: TIGR00730 family Rossman fold protein [Alphaproteobacteria bacterium]|nr:TIGR00730 family Rossman fold protein [Alphaproteobacteria bacterium]
MHTLQGVCVFCGSSPGNDPIYLETARQLGQILAKAGVPLVFGGGSLGLMGEVAGSTMKAGGRVTGIIPEFLRNVEPPLGSISELIVTRTMHERKARMFALSDAFAVLPGGIGTLEETVEMLTWSQLRLHKKPVVIINTQGYWTPLVSLLDSFVQRQFARDSLHDLYSVVDTPDAVLPAIYAALQHSPA